MITNKTTTRLFAGVLAGALAMIVLSRLQEPPAKKPGGSARRDGEATERPSAAGARSDAIASPFAAATTFADAGAEPENAENAPSRAARPERPSVYQGPTWFDDDEEKLVTRLSSDRPEEIRFATRDVDHVERREDGETVIVLRRGASVLVTDELLEAAPEALRERIAYEGPPVSADEGSAE